MKQKTRKHLITGIIVLIWLLGCYFIGQVMHPQDKTVSETMLTNVSSTEKCSEETVAQKTQGEEENDNVAESTTVTFFDVQQLSKDEIPWGFSAGTIIMEDGSEAWLLTPGTSLTFNSIGNTLLEYQIHPWMKGISDGATLIIYAGADQKILEVTSNPDEFSIGMGIVKLELINSEKNEGDWVIIQQKYGN